MNVLIKEALGGLVRFWAVKSRRRLVFLGLLAAAALIEIIALGLARRTFVFYAIDSGQITVEDRMLKRSLSREVNITRYVEEALLGPVSPDSLPLFPRETRLRSLLYRDGIVYADFSEAAALPPLAGGEVFNNFRTLYSGIRRNFSFVKDVRFFITGKAAYAEEFRQMGEVKGRNTGNPAASPM
ncbi:MAG: GerMN domain-containing protein [Treponema sp.]|jgi:hypothetical protein|nr:GerMN domain-containing protein [Treponema sp.]